MVHFLIQSISLPNKPMMKTGIGSIIVVGGEWEASHLYKKFQEKTIILKYEMEFTAEDLKTFVSLRYP